MPNIGTPQSIPAFVIALTLVLPVKAQEVIFDSGFEAFMFPLIHFVTTWQDYQPDTVENLIQAGGFQDGFPETTLSDLIEGDQAAPAIAAAANGMFIAVWEDDTDGNGFYQIHGRGFNADGTERIPRFTINSASAGQQRRPDIAMAPNGDFVVVWEDDPDGNGFFNILGRGFYANGTERFADKTVAMTGAGSERRPSIDMTDDGRFVVAWEDDTDYNGFFQIKARGFHAGGGERFPAFTVNTAGAGQQIQPRVSLAANGDFVVIWADDQDVNFFHQVFARGFNADGTERFADITVNQVGTGDQSFPAVGVADDGSFVAAWLDQGHRIMSRRFNASGVAQSNDVVMNTNELEYQLFPEIGVTGQGDFVVVWQYLLDDGRYGLNARSMSANGEMSAEFAISSTTTGDQVTPALAVY